MAMLLASCATSISLKTDPLEEPPKDDERIFTLIYFVGTDKSDIRRAVILDVEGDKYTFRPRTEDFQYEILQNISIKESLYEAELFFKYEGNKGYNTSRVLGPDGALIGYELKPLYFEDFKGDEDILNISYSLNPETGLVQIKIKLKASLKRIVY